MAFHKGQTVNAGNRATDNATEARSTTEKSTPTRIKSFSLAPSTILAPARR